MRRLVARSPPATGTPLSKPPATGRTPASRAPRHRNARRMYCRRRSLGSERRQKNADENVTFIGVLSLAFGRQRTPTTERRRQILCRRRSFCCGSFPPPTNGPDDDRHATKFPPPTNGPDADEYCRRSFCCVSSLLNKGEAQQKERKQNYLYCLGCPSMPQVVSNSGKLLTTCGHRGTCYLWS
jgi:hypothetical protein